MTHTRRNINDDINILNAPKIIKRDINSKPSIIRRHVSDKFGEVVPKVLVVNIEKDSKKDTKRETKKDTKRETKRETKSKTKSFT